MSNIDIKYLNKDFTSLKNALIEYAKAYYPTVYNDFTAPSPGSLFIDLASYTGDVLSFYLDNQIQETFLQYANQPTNLYTMAYMLGYKPKVTSAATVPLTVYQLLPSKVENGEYVPDYDFALLIEGGMEVSSGTGDQGNFYVPEAINFALSSSSSPTEVVVESADPITGDPQFYLLSKTVQALSGTVNTATFIFNNAVKFDTRTLQDTNIIQILSVVDSDGNEWYEVPYLAQDTILEAIANTGGLTPNLGDNSYQTPYFMQVKKVPRRFTTRVTTSNTLELQFGSGINTVADEAVLPNANKTGIGTVDALSKINTAYDPANFTTTYTYGLAPSNTTLTVKYLVGGGAQANVLANTLTTIKTINSRFVAGLFSSTIPTLPQTIQNSVVVNNETPAAGGGDGDSLEDVRLNTLLQFPTQLRAVTQQDYIAQVYSMPGKFGAIAKAYIVKDNAVLRNIDQNMPGVTDPFATSIYVLGYDLNGNLTQASLPLKENLKTYLSQYRMLTDTIYIKDAYIVNIGVVFDIILRPNYAGREVILECITQLKDYFNTDKWEVNQPIVLSDVYTLLDRITGVQTVRKVEVINKYGTVDGYSEYTYDISSATLNNIIYPSLDPSIFEVRYPDTDIVGRVVAF